MKYIVIFIGCIAFSSSYGQDSGAKRAAAESLNTFRKSINAENYKMLNLASADEIQGWTVGEEIKNFFIRLDELKKFRAGDNADQLLKASGKTMLVLTNREQAVGIMELEKIKDEWKTKSIGKSDEIGAYSRYIKSSGLVNASLVKVLALNRNFVAYQKDNQWKAVLLGDTPLDTIRPLQEVDLKDVIPALQKEAEAYNGLPW